MLLSTATVKLRIIIEMRPPYRLQFTGYDTNMWKHSCVMFYDYPLTLTINWSQHCINRADTRRATKIAKKPRSQDKGPLQQNLAFRFCWSGHQGTTWTEQHTSLSKQPSDSLKSMISFMLAQQKLCPQYQYNKLTVTMEHHCPTRDTPCRITPLR